MLGILLCIFASWGVNSVLHHFWNSFLNYRDQREVEQMSSHSIYICMLHRVSMPKVSSTLHFDQPINDTCNFWSFWSQVSWGSECAVLCNFWCAPCCMLQRLILCVMMFAAFCCDHRHDSTAKRRSGLTRGDLGFLNLTRMTVEWKSLSGPFFFLLCSVCLGVSCSLLCYLHRAKIGFHITFHIPMCSLVV